FDGHFGYSDDSLEICVALHNQGKIDLLSLTDKPAIQEIEGPRFFIGQHFFCEAIPNLTSSLEEMTRAVQDLVKKAGKDGAANRPYVAFQKWCEKDMRRTQSVISAAALDDALPTGIVASALVAGNMFEDAKKFATGHVHERRICDQQA